MERIVPQGYSSAVQRGSGVWRTIAACLLAGATIPCACAAAADTGSQDASPERLVFLLEYIAADYGNAVRDGKVADAAEYAEMTEFSRVVAEHVAQAAVSEAIVTK